MHLGGDASHLAGENTAGFSRELGQHFRILVADFLEWKVETLGRHRLVVLAEVNPALNGLGFRHDKIGKSQGLSKLAVERAAIEKGIKLLLLETARSVEAFFVTGAGVTGGRLPFGLGLGAFQYNNIAWHNLEKSEIGTRKL